jgi:hypothetical protein
MHIKNIGMTANRIISSMSVTLIVDSLKSDACTLTFRCSSPTCSLVAGQGAQVQGGHREVSGGFVVVKISRHVVVSVIVSGNFVIVMYSVMAGAFTSGCSYCEGVLPSAGIPKFPTRRRLFESRVLE